jgi:hypothetical protein
MNFRITASLLVIAGALIFFFMYTELGRLLWVAMGFTKPWF